MNPWYRVETFRLALGLGRVLPRRTCRLLAGLLGNLSYHLARRARTCLRANLAPVTGLDGPALDAVCRRNFRNFLRMLADYFHFSGRAAPDLVPLLAARHGIEHLRAALAEGRGALLVTAHLGNWELGGIQLALQGFPITVVTLAEPGAVLGRWRADYRRRFGIETITVGTDAFGFVEIGAALRKGRAVAMLVDRPYGGTGIPVRLFGRTTEFTTGPAILRRHFQTPVLPAFLLQRADDRYDCRIEPPLEFAPAADPRTAPAADAQCIADVMAPLIRQHPDQWHHFVPVWK